jgi:DNA-binding transcriptional LysR family regulator
MDSAALQAFLTVAETGSFSLAAERLFLTQPAVSKRIAALESELDTPLFDRIGRKITLTEAGRILFPRAQKILLELEDSRRAINNLSMQVTGTLSLGTSHHIGLHRLPPVLRSYASRYPEVDLDLQFMGSEAACAGVLHGEIELGIVTLPLQAEENLALIPIWEDSLVIVAGKDHALAKTKKVTAEQLAQTAVILPGKKTFTRELIEKEFRQLGLQLHVKLSTNYLETIKMMVSIGLGWSVLPVTMVSEPDFKLIKLANIQFKRQLGVVHHTQRTLSNAARVMIELLDELYRETD